jgi:hypothetical protein
MTIRLGTGELSALKLGSTDIGKAYLGPTEIWSTGLENILDTYTQNGGQIWRSANSWWNGLSSGTWASTGTANGTYLECDAGTQLSTVFFRFGPSKGNVPAGSRVRVTFTPSTGGPGPALLSSPIGGDETFNWESGTQLAADMEDGGNWGWDNTDTVVVELIAP